MRELPFLDERLALLASLVREGSIAADIGADHGHLIAWLVGRGICPHGFACDINKKPLEQSRTAARRFCVEDKISFVLSNGLAGLNEADVDDIIIAGMGGDLITEILGNAGWHSHGKQFLLQPMTRADELRRWLCANGYELCSEHAARANGFSYTAIIARYTGAVRHCTPLFAAVGIMPQVNTPEARAYILRQAEAVKQKMLGLAASKDHADEALPLQMLYNNILETLKGGSAMTTLNKIYNVIDKFAPFSTCESWDNCGILVRGEDENITKALLALDITTAVIEEANELGAGLIISHHPIIFEPLSKLDHTHPAYRLAEYGISAICAHTNLDLAEGGINDVLAQRLWLQNIQPLGAPNADGLSLGRIGDFRLSVEPDIALNFFKKNLGSSGVKHTSRMGVIERVAVCGGAGGELTARAAELGAHAFVTGEVRHHQLLLAAELGIMLISAGHFATEHVILEPLAELLRRELPEAEFFVAKCETNPMQYL